MKLLILILLTAAITLAQDNYAELLEIAVCETGVNYSVISESHISSTEQEFLMMSAEKLNSLSEPEQIAWYSNLYNFYTIKLIVENFPLKSITDLKSPWDRKFIPLFGKKKISLNHLEHQIIRKRYDEPRIHFALNCASIGCPPLRAEPYSGDRLDEQLDDMAMRFLTDTTRNRIENSTLFLSQIFQWYGDDFNKRHGSYQNYVKQVLGVSGKIKVTFLEYDWDLNNSDCK